MSCYRVPSTPHPSTAQYFNVITGFLQGGRFLDDPRIVAKVIAAENLNGLTRFQGNVSHAPSKGNQAAWQF